MDRIIEVKINGNFLTKDNKNAGVQHEGNVTALRIEFDPGWDGYAKKVTWWDAKGLNPVERTLTADLLEDMLTSTRIYLVPIPTEPLAEAGACTFVVDGYISGKRQRSIADTLLVKAAPFKESASQPTDPTPTQAEQLQVQIDALLDDITEQQTIATTAAATATTKAGEASASATAAAGSSAAAAGSASSAASSAQTATEKAASAEESASAAKASEDDVAANAAAAAESEANAKASETAAAGSATTASAKATAAAASAETAKGKASAAETSAFYANQSAANAESHASTAMTAANAASSFSANAAESASSAQAAKAAAESAADALNVWETYSAAKTYQPLNKVVYDGSSYCCIAESTGHAPTDTNYWLLIAQRGQDGSGTGDMLKLTYDPQNKAQDVFAYADGKAPLVVTITEDDGSGEFSSNHDAFEICDAFRAGRVVFANVDEDVWMLDRVFGNRDEYGRAEAYFGYYMFAPIQDANDAWHFGLVRMEISVTTQATDETSTNFETLVGMSTKQIDAIGVGAVPSAGGTMTGALTLSGDPTADLHAATKKYVDDAIGGAIGGSY